MDPPPSVARDRMRHLGEHHRRRRHELLRWLSEVCITHAPTTFLNEEVFSAWECGEMREIKSK